MKHTKIILALIAVLNMTATTMAQTMPTGRFEWAKGYTSSEEACHIIGAVTDSVGNLYILGQYNDYAAWDGEAFLYVSDYYPMGTIIAKISPDGEMLWKKVIHTGNYANDQPFDIKPLGDTAFACLVNVEMPSFWFHCYYLDTMIVGWSDYPVPIDPHTVTSTIFTTYLVFDFSGNLLEQHFLQTSYLDTAGNDYYFTYPGTYLPDKLFKFQLMNPTFDLDGEGNIYLTRQVYDGVDDSTSVEAGTFSGVRFWVDGRCVGTTMVGSGHHWRQEQQVLKFAPHFDTLLAARYLFDRASSYVDINDTYTKVDKESNVYTICNIYPDVIEERTDTIVVDSLQGLSFYNCNIGVKAVMVRLDKNLVPDWMVTLEDSVVNPDIHVSSSGFHGVEFDYDSNLIFLSISSGRGVFDDTVNRYSIPMVDGTPVYIKNSAAVLVFERTETKPRLRSYGMVPAVNTSGSYFMNSMACGNGRIFLQSNFSGGLRIPGNEHIGSTIFYTGSGLTIFDYEGHVIGGTSYYTSSPQSRPGAIALRDSTLYLVTRLYDDNATFGDLTIHGNSIFSAVVKYVDTAFMSPYVFVPSQDTVDVHIGIVDNEASFVVYPNPFSQRVNVQCDKPVTAAWLTDMMGRREGVKLTAIGDGHYTLDLAGRPQAIYLLTLLTADGQQHTIRLIKRNKQ